MTAAPLLRAEKVGLRFGEVVALSDASISVHEGETWAIVGAYGCGKSSLLRVLAALESPSRAQGTVAYARSSPLATQRAFVPQRPEVGAAFSARDVVRLGRFAIGRDESAVDRALADVGLLHRAHLAFSALSGGERQRVAIARAFAQVDAGGVLLLDEPFSGIDPAEIARIACALRVRARRGAVVLSLHDPGLARAIATHAAILRGGRVIQTGDAAEVLTAVHLTAAYAHPMQQLGGWIVPDLADGR